MENADTPPALLQRVESFLAATGMGPTYFGAKACGNAELVRRLRSGGRVWPETIQQVDAFMGAYWVQQEKGAAN